MSPREKATFANHTKQYHKIKMVKDPRAQNLVPVGNVCESKMMLMRVSSSRRIPVTSGVLT